MPILGTITTANPAANELPEDWDRSLYLVFPNGEVPLCVLFGQMPTAALSHPRYHWFNKGLPVQRIFAVGAYLAGDTLLTVDDNGAPPVGAAFELTVGQCLLVESTGEIMRVAATPNVVNQVTVVRGTGTVAAAAIADNAGFTILASAYEENAEAPDSIYTNPTERFNFAQSVMRSAGASRRMLQTEVRWAGRGIKYEIRREALQRYYTEWEKTMFFGQAFSGLQNGRPITHMGGVVGELGVGLDFDLTSLADPEIPGNVAGLLDENTLELLLNRLFAFGGSEKVMFCGDLLRLAIHQIIRGNWVPNDIKETYGIKFSTLEYGGSFLHVKVHPLFRQNAFLRNQGVIMDFTAPKMKRTIQPTILRTAKQDNRRDGYFEFVQGDLGVQWTNSNQVDMRWRNVNGATS